jgi:hypothetical protein
MATAACGVAKLRLLLAQLGPTAMTAFGSLWGVKRTLEHQLDLRPSEPHHAIQCCVGDLRDASDKRDVSVSISQTRDGLAASTTKRRFKLRCRGSHVIQCKENKRSTQ